MSGLTLLLNLFFMLFIITYQTPGMLSMFPLKKQIEAASEDHAREIFKGILPDDEIILIEEELQQ